MSQEQLNLEGLENEVVATATETTTKKAKKEMTAEEIDLLVAASIKMQEFGVSPELTKVMELIPVWHSKELAAPVKEAVIAHFGGSEAFKDYIEGTFAEEVAVFAAIGKAVSTLNNIKSFYARRESKGGSKKEKMVTFNIDGKYYEASASFVATLDKSDKDAFKTAILEHEATREATSIEVL